MTQNRSEFVSFADHCRHDFRIDALLEGWSTVGRLVTRPFERERLKSKDVVEDFLDVLGLEPEGERSLVNQSIGGNLLFFRLIENRLGLPKIDYRKAEKLAREHPPFGRAFHISDEAAAAIRASSSYNRVVADYVGGFALKSYADQPVVPIMETLDSDLERVYTGRGRREGVRSRLGRAVEQAPDWLRWRPPQAQGYRQKARESS